jgi:hypothetical protein
MVILPKVGRAVLTIGSCGVAAGISMFAPEGGTMSPTQFNAFVQLALPPPPSQVKVLAVLTVMVWVSITVQLKPPSKDNSSLPEEDALVGTTSCKPVSVKVSAPASEALRFI